MKTRKSKFEAGNSEVTNQKSQMAGHKSQDHLHFKFPISRFQVPFSSPPLARGILTSDNGVLFLLLRAGKGGRMDLQFVVCNTDVNRNRYKGV